MKQTLLLVLTVFLLKGCKTCRKDELVYSRFIEYMQLSYAYREEDFGLFFRPAVSNRYEIRERDRSHARALGLRQGLGVRQERFFLLFLRTLIFFLNKPSTGPCRSVTCLAWAPTHPSTSCFPGIRIIPLIVSC